MLTDDEKNMIVKEYEGLVRKLARRYSFFDTDPEEVLGFAFLGLAEAINSSERNVEYEGELNATAVTLRVKSTIFKAYSKRSRESRNKSMHAQAGEGENEYTVEDSLADEKTLRYSASEIRSLVMQALEPMEENERLALVANLLDGLSMEKSAKKHEVNLKTFSKMKRRGIAIIKKYLLDNAIVENIEMIEKYRYNGQRLKSLSIEKIKKIKYLRYQGFLTINDISAILNVNSFQVNELFYLSTARFKNAEADPSVHDEMVAYVKAKYPERYSEVNFQTPVNL